MGANKNTRNNPTEIKGSELTDDQLSAASDFLSGANWKTNQAVRQTSRADIVRLLAWYAAVRYQAGVHGIGTLEKPGSTNFLNPEQAATANKEFELIIEGETDR